MYLFIDATLVPASRLLKNLFCVTSCHEKFCFRIQFKDKLNVLLFDGHLKLLVLSRDVARLKKREKKMRLRVVNDKREFCCRAGFVRAEQRFHLIKRRTLKTALKAFLLGQVFAFSLLLWRRFYSKNWRLAKVS